MVTTKLAGTEPRRALYLHAQINNGSLTNVSISSPEVAEQSAGPISFHAETLRQVHHLAVIGVQVASALVP